VGDHFLLELQTEHLGQSVNTVTAALETVRQWWSNIYSHTATEIIAHLLAFYYSLFFLVSCLPFSLRMYSNFFLSPCTTKKQTNCSRQILCVGHGISAILRSHILATGLSILPYFAVHIHKY